MTPENTPLPVLPYAGTSGWSGSETSRERAEAADTSGETTRRQIITLEIISAAGDDGITWQVLSNVTGWHHGIASGLLSVLHKSGHIERLTARRDRCQIYVMPEHVNGRELATYKRNGSAEIITELREALIETERLLAAAIQRNERQAQTIRELWAR